MTLRPLPVLVSLALALPAGGTAAHAHGVVGPRFFPATIATDDPFAADELALPTVTSFDHETDYDLEYAKTLVSGVALSIGLGYIDANPPGGSHASGFDNIELSPLAELFRDSDRETIVTAGLVWEIGGSGSKAVADRFSTYTPEILFGKGFGDLPDDMALLRPLAVTGQIGFRIPGSSTESRSVEWSGAVEYSLLYLQSNVKDEGFAPFVTRLTPIVEYVFSSPTDAGGGGTTGTINPGIIWSGQSVQLALEAIIPVNTATGSSVGAIAQLHFYIDDIFPDSLGRPLFGAEL